MTRGEIWWVSFGDGDGHERARPCAIVSPDVMIGHLKSVIVAPLTSRGRAAAFRPAVQFDGLDGVLLLDQLQSVDTTRLVRRAGALNEKVLGKALSTLQAMFAE